MSTSSDQSNSDAQDSVPKAVVSRLSLYLRELQHLIRDGRDTTSSTQLGSMLGLTDAQVRKDLAYFGQFGYPGVGYRCNELVSEIKKILGTDQQWHVLLVGVGNLGRALLGYKGFGQQGFRIMAAFDTDRSKTGKVFEGVRVYHLDDLARIVEEQNIRLAMIAVPSEAVQPVVDQVVDAGIEGIMNFVPVTISVPDGVRKVGVDLAIELEQLSYAVVKSGEKV
jgi:redox-sensing transcriptional repressor